MSTFAERLKSFRKGISTANFAKKLGISGGALNNYERGLSVPNGKKLIHISEQLGVSVEWLLHGIEVEDKASETTNFLGAMKGLPRDAACSHCGQLYGRLVHAQALLIKAQEREIALLKENAALQAKIKS